MDNSETQTTLDARHRNKTNKIDITLNTRRMSNTDHIKNEG